MRWCGRCAGQGQEESVEEHRMALWTNVATAMLDIGVWVGVGMEFQILEKAQCRSQVQGLSDI